MQVIAYKVGDLLYETLEAANFAAKIEALRTVLANQHDWRITPNAIVLERDLVIKILTTEDPEEPPRLAAAWATARAKKEAKR